MHEQELDTYWKTVVDTIQDAVMIVDPIGTIVSVNKAFEAVTGYGKEEIIGKSCTLLNCNICEVAREKKEGHWCLLFKNGTLSKRRCLLLTKDRRYVHVLKNASILKDSDGQVIGGVETMTDISELVAKDSQIEAFRRQLQSRDGFHGILGASIAMQRLFDLTTNAARSDAPVIILGESGTGKELVAAALHELSERRRKPLVKINCAALTESLLESELFGHVKGAFTGAHKDRKGRFETASGGYIFLDEIGDLPLSTQVKLLRVLEEKVIERVGDNRSIAVDVRIISATNRDLKDLVAKGIFREDLFYRINVIPITVPPLRERASDIPLLANAFFQRIRLKRGQPVQGISNDAMAILANYAWPGNVRELKSAFEYAFVNCHGGRIQPHHLPPNIVAAVHPTPLPAEGKMNAGAPFKKQQLIEALGRAGGNQSEAARLLGVSRVTVWHRIKRFGLSPDQFRRRPAGWPDTPT